VSRHPIHQIDDAVHQRVRLGILAECVNTTRVDFTHLKQTLDLTDGNLGRHLQTLEEAGLVTIERDTGTARPRSWIRITRRGRAALRREVAALRAILDAIDVPGAERAGAEPPPRAEEPR
jgi:DNA-binding MarR family transcriptional regulator